MIDLQTNSRGLILPVRASAGARCNAILGVRNGSLRIAVSAAPEKGKANSAIATLLSKALGIPKSAIEIIAGETSQRKRILLVGNNTAALRQSLEQIIRKIECDASNRQ